MELSGRYQVPATLFLAKDPGTNWTGAWWAPEPFWNFGEDKKFIPVGIRKPDLPARGLVLLIYVTEN
jgi:hypothetical protein